MSITAPCLMLNFLRGTTLDPRIAFSRASTGTFIGVNGLVQNASAGVPRFEFNPGTDLAGSAGAPLGFLVEGASTSEGLWCRDLTNAAWTKTNMSTALSQAGSDGVASSATLLTATAANATVKQAITGSSSARALSADVKRVTGSGEIDMTLDGGSTWVNVTSQIGVNLGPNGYSRIVISQTLANPNIGFRIVVSGDAIAVDFVQEEPQSFASSRILTTSAQVTRAADVATMLLSSISGQNVGVEGAMVAEAMLPDIGRSYQPTMFQINDGTQANSSAIFFGFNNPPKGGVYSATASAAQYNVQTDPPIIAKQTSRLAFSWKANSAYSAHQGAIGPVVSSYTAPLGVNTLTIGHQVAGAFPLSGWIRFLTIFPRQIAQFDLQRITQ